MTEKMVDWCIAELQFKAKAFQENGGLVSVYNGDVVKSDTAVPPELQESLRAAVAPLEDIPDRLKDWHPGSDDIVLDLVHPSLFPLVYGRSKVLKEGVTTLDDCIERCGEGEAIPAGTGGVAPQRLKISWRTVDLRLFSVKFQWLPCEVDISANDGNSVRSVYLLLLNSPRSHKRLAELRATLIIYIRSSTLGCIASLSKSSHEPFLCGI
jgi:hypothetical protein